MNVIITNSIYTILQFATIQKSRQIYTHKNSHFDGFLSLSSVKLIKSANGLLKMSKSQLFIKMKRQIGENR